MKKTITISLIIFTISCMAQTSITAIYKKELGNFNSVMIKNKPKSVDNFLKKYHSLSKEILQQISFEFKTNNIKSIMKPKPSGLVEEKKGYQVALSTGTIDVSGVHYYDAFKKKQLHQRETFGELFLINKKIKKHKWILENTQKIIGGFNCSKARTSFVTINAVGVKKEHFVICWYTPQIPINLGPIGYNGLPGLIVVLQDGTTRLMLQKIVQHKKTIKIKEPTKGIKMKSQQEYEKKAKEYFYKMIGKKRKN